MDYRSPTAMSRSPPAWESTAFDDANDDKGHSALSTMFTETAAGWHVLKVEGYSHINGILGVARRVKSYPFVIGGHTWCITYFPSGLTVDPADWIAFALRLERRATGTDDDVRVRAKFTLLDEGGDPLPLPSLAASCGGRVWTFSRTCQSWSHARFMKKREFELSIVKDDKFSIRCDITVVEEHSGRLSAAAAPSPDLQWHLGELLASGDGADVTLEVGGEVFAVHRTVLATRSPVFSAMFFGGPLMENGASRVHIDDVKPSVFRALLHFIYTDSLSWPGDIDGGETSRTVVAQHLLVAADRYGVDGLKSLCECVLCLSVDARTVVTTLVLAEQHGCHQLKETCIKVLSSSANFMELIGGDDFQHLAKTCHTLLEELYNCLPVCHKASQRRLIGHAGPSTSTSQPQASGAAVVYGSASTVSAKKATGWHVLKVENYSRTKDRDGTTWRVKSASFIVGGYALCIMYPPAGIWMDDPGWISFGLSLLHPPSASTASTGAEELDDVMVQTRYSLLNHAGQPLPSSITIDGGACTLSSLLKYSTSTPFMERQRFESSSYVNDDGFSVRCDVTVVRRTCRMSGVVPPPDLPRHLGELLATGVGADVTFEVGGEEFAAHRSVLTARSPVFKAELLNRLSDEDHARPTSRVRIDGIEPAVFGALLHFIYTDSLPEIDAR